MSVSKSNNDKRILLRELSSRSSDVSRLSEINNEAFPEYDRSSVDDLFDMAEKTNAKVFGIYDQEGPANTSEDLVGFLVLVIHQQCGYISYFAIAAEKRGCGLGSRSLKVLFETYPELVFVIDIEPIDPAAENFAQRLFRKRFYQKNGFYPSGYVAIWDDAAFEILSTLSEFDVRPFKDLIAAIREAFSDFGPELRETAKLASKK